MRTLLIALVGSALASTGLRAQCAGAPRNPQFEFQVHEPAQFSGKDGAFRPVTGAAERDAAPEGLLLQLLVDTAGIPVAATVKVLKSDGVLPVDSVRAEVPRWRFTPAVLAGCRVTQLVQAPVVRAVPAGRKDR